MLYCLSLFFAAANLLASEDDELMKLKDEAHSVLLFPTVGITSITEDIDEDGFAEPDAKFIEHKYLVNLGFMISQEIELIKSIQSKMVAKSKSENYPPVHLRKIYKMRFLYSNRVTQKEDLFHVAFSAKCTFLKYNGLWYELEDGFGGLVESKIVKMLSKEARELGDDGP